MLVYKQQFYGSSGELLTILSQDNLFTTFSNNQKFATFEVELALKNEASSKSLSISNRLELERRQNKNK